MVTKIKLTLQCAPCTLMILPQTSFKLNCVVLISCQLTSILSRGATIESIIRQSNDEDTVIFEL